jgi:hypothetical protein
MRFMHASLVRVLLWFGGLACLLTPAFAATATSVTDGIKTDFFAGSGELSKVKIIAEVTAIGHEERIDVHWPHAQSMYVKGYAVYRADRASGPFVRLHNQLLTTAVYSDFIGANDETRWYRVDALGYDGQTLSSLGLAKGVSRAQNDDEFMTSVQEATFRYFWDFAHPTSGLIRERSNEKLHICAVGGTGFGLFAIMIGVERGFITREQAVERINQQLRFLEEKAERYHGVFAHWIDGRTGKTIAFSEYDDGGDIVETSFLMQGILTVRNYFSAPNAAEHQLRERSTRLWEAVNWKWYLGPDEDSKTLFWHWSPTHAWKMNLPVGGGFNETMITYLLAIASPTHPIDPDCYYEGWVRDNSQFVNGSDYYGYTQWVGDARGGPLFFTHYSFIGLDPRGLRDRYCDYFENNRNISLINRSYCIENPGQFVGYSDVCWGLTASDGPDGYKVHAPGLDDGTIAPTAALSAIPYTPAESMAAMRHFYHAHGKRLWGTFGFKDAFNLTRNWFADSYLAIDQGPIIGMIENHRTGLCWHYFMTNNNDVHVALNKVKALHAFNAPDYPPSASVANDVSQPIFAEKP